MWKKGDKLTKEDLKNLFYLEKEIKCKEEQLAELYSLAEKTTSSSRAHRGTNRASDRIGETASLIADLKADLEKSYSLLLNAKKAAMKEISRISDINRRLVLEKRYLLRLPWVKIAAEMNYSLDHIYTLHRRAINHLEHM